MLRIIVAILKPIFRKLPVQIARGVLFGVFEQSFAQLILMRRVRVLPLLRRALHLLGLGRKLV
tara:strand:+ start:428 stop:616 length:189 start_codon:yes stop_codon:yes gene_type:complete